MKITKTQKALARFASKSDIRLELACIHTDGRVAQATDSFRLVEITNLEAEAGDPVLVRAKSVEGAKVPRKGDQSLELAGGSLKNSEGASFPAETRPASEYPEVAQIWKRAEGRGYAEVKLNGEYLAEIATLLATLDPFGKVVLRVPTESAQDPIIITAKNKEQEARALLMPMSA